eukprot:SAG11_NODE_27547_length_331_cov_1.103448_1_plen_26_part_10
MPIYRDLHSADRYHLDQALASFEADL